MTRRPIALRANSHPDMPRHLDVPQCAGNAASVCR
jgi:hypothetical protein